MQALFCRVPGEKSDAAYFGQLEWEIGELFVTGQGRPAGDIFYGKDGLWEKLVWQVEKKEIACHKKKWTCWHRLKVRASFPHFNGTDSFLKARTAY